MCLSKQPIYGSSPKRLSIFLAYELKSPVTVYQQEEPEWLNMKRIVTYSQG